MKQLSLFFKRWNLKQVLMVLFAGFFLLFNTACSNGNIQGARPNNPPVQMGGNNNPHSRGGDGYTNYKMSNDPAANKKQSALPSGRIIATGSIKSNASDLIYPGSNGSETDHPDIGPVQQRKLSDLPNPKQPMIDRTNPDAKILERVGTAFQDATSFVKDTVDSAGNRPETKLNPAIGQ